MSSPIKIAVTGGSRGIGLAIALRFARAGFQVGILARQAASLAQAQHAAEQEGIDLKTVQVDFAQADQIAPAVTKMAHLLGDQVDIWVNNAGIFDMAPLEATSEAMWRSFLEINLTAPFLATQSVMPWLRKSSCGHLINVSSVAGQQGFPGNAAYCASKYGLRGLSDALRAEFQADGVYVSTIYPGATDTDIFNTVEGNWDRSGMNKPEDVAQVAWDAHLAVQRAAATGQPAPGDWEVAPRAPDQS